MVRLAASGASLHEVGRSGVASGVDRELVFSLGVSLAIGLLVGLERQIALDQRGDSHELLPGGVRTFPLVALAGSLAVMLTAVTPWALPVALVGLVALLAAFRLGLPVERREAGFTTDVAVMLTFFLGALAVSRLIEELSARLLTTAALGVVVTVLLSLKPRLHAAVRRISPADVYATLQILLVAVVLLPLLPNRAYGPYEAINPQQIGRMILFIGSISFVGYAASRLVGPGRGLTLTGLVGGLVSSTAVTFAMARRARADERVASAAAVAVVAASAMMFLRVLVAAAVIHPPLVGPLAVPIGAMAVVGGIALFPLRRKAKDEEKHTATVELKNPFELKSALVFGLLFAGVIFVSKAADATLGVAALYLTAVVAGTTDVDAITLSTAALASGGLSASVATTTILVACFSNTAVKAGITFVIGGAAFGWRVARVFGAMIGAGALALAALAILGGD